MATESRFILVGVDCPAADAYRYISNPAHLPEWAAGLGSTVEKVDGDWVIESPLGRIVISFVAANSLGVLDHHVTLPTGESFYNPMRVLPDGTGCEVIFMVRRRPDQTYEAFCADVEMVEADLARLKHRLESQPID